MKRLAVATVVMVLAILAFIAGAWNGSTFLILTMCPGSLVAIWFHGFVFSKAGIRISLEAATSASQPAPTASQRQRQQRQQSVAEKISEFN